MKRTISILLVCLLLTLIISPKTINADALQDQLNQLNQQIGDLQTQKTQLQGQINSNQFKIQGVNSSISNLFAQISLNTKQINQLKLQIEQSQVTIKIINKNILDDNKKISDAIASIASLSSESNYRIQTNFQDFKSYGQEDITGNLINFAKINDYFKTSIYKEIIQSNTNQIMTKLVTLQSSLTQDQVNLKSEYTKQTKQLDILASQQSSFEDANNQLNSQVASYEHQLSAFQQLNVIAQTQAGSISQQESQKKALINQIQNEIQHENIIITPPPPGGGGVTGKFVNAGTAIGIEGSTGVATAIHLHFVVLQNGSRQDPCRYLSSGGATDIFGLGNCGSGGGLSWPMRGTVYYTNSFNGFCLVYCPHGAIDLQGVPLDSVVYAAQSGYISKFTDSSGANVVQICQNTNCNTGLTTQYWHLRSFLF